MFQLCLLLNCYLFSISTNLYACNASSLNGHPSTLAYIPSNIDPKTRLEFSLSSFSNIPETRICSAFLSHNSVGIGVVHMGDNEINENHFIIGTKREINEVHIGSSLTLVQRNFERFQSFDLITNLGASKFNDNFGFGAAFKRLWKNPSNSLSLFCTIKEDFGKTFIDLYFCTKGDKGLSLSQELRITDFLILSLGYSKNPEIYHLGLTIPNYLKPSFACKYSEDLGFITSWGIEYTF